MASMKNFTFTRSQGHPAGSKVVSAVVLDMLAISSFELTKVCVTSYLLDNTTSDRIIPVHTSLVLNFPAGNYNFNQWQYVEQSGQGAISEPQYPCPPSSPDREVSQLVLPDTRILFIVDSILPAALANGSTQFCWVTFYYREIDQSGLTKEQKIDFDKIEWLKPGKAIGKIGKAIPFGSLE